MILKRTLSLFLTLICIQTYAQVSNPIQAEDQVIQGFGEKVSGTDFWYNSALPDIHDALLVRAIDGKQTMTWSTEPIRQVSSGRFTQFVWMAGLGSNLGNVPMFLSVNGTERFTFATSRRQNWDIDGREDWKLSFRTTLVDGAGDLFGFMFLRIPNKDLEAGKSIQISVSGSASNSQAWYMTFMSPIPTGITYKSFPAAFYEDGYLVQPVSVQIVYFGEPTTGELWVNGKKNRDIDLSFGIQKFQVNLPAVDYPAPFTFHIKSAPLDQEETLTLEPVRPWKINFVQHTHTDIGYTRPQTEILAEHLRYIDYALDYCDATDNYPDESKFRWTCEAAFAVDNYLKSRPAKQVERLKKRIQEGRIEVTGMYFNFDETPDEQTYAASIQTLKRFQEAGIPVQTAMQDDVNGIGWCFADFFPPTGVKYLNMGTHGHRALIAFDKPTAFWWESPSGNRLLTFRAEHYMFGNTVFGIHSQNFDYFESKVMEYLDQLGKKGYEYNTIPIQHSGFQTDNSPPSTLACDMVLQWNKKYLWPKLRISTVSEFFETIEKEHGSELPVIRGAWPDWWTDGYGSAAREVAAARQAHTDIIANQGALSMALTLGASLPPGINERIDLANKALLFYDEHTFGHAQSVREPYFEGTMEQRSLKESYAWEAFRRSRLVGEEAMGLLQEYISRNSTYPTLAIFNTLNWTRSGLAKVYIDHQLLPMGISFKIVDENEEPVRVQALENRSDGTYWGIWVKDIPGFGYKTFTIQVEEDEVPLPEETSTIPDQFENDWYQGKINLETATIENLWDKEMKVDLVDSLSEWRMGEIILEKLGNRSQIESLTLNDYTRATLDTVWFEAYFRGEVWDTWRFKGESSTTIGPAGFQLEIRVFHLQKRIDFVYMIRKKAITDPEAIYISFPFNLEGGKIFCEVQGGVMESGVDQIPGSTNDWNTIQNFASVRNSEGQILISSQKMPLMQFGDINTGRFNAQAKPESTHIFGWPMNNYWTTNFNADQRGEITFTYSVTSSTDASNLVSTKFGWGNRVPLLTRVLPAGIPNGASASTSLLNIQPDHLLLVNAKPLPEEHALLLQLREVGGTVAEFSLTASRAKVFLIETNVLGQPMGKRNQTIRFKPYESKFIKLSFKP